MAAPLDAQLVFGWREPQPRLAAPLDSRTPSRAGRDGARIVLASDQAPRLAEILAEAGHPAAVVPGLSEAPPPTAIAIIERSLNGGFVGGPRASRSSPTASCSGTSGSARRRCGGSCRATSSNG